jgi:hypothetical protein
MPNLAFFSSGDPESSFDSRGLLPAIAFSVRAAARHHSFPAYWLA